MGVLMNDSVGKLSEAAYAACFSAMTDAEHKLMAFVAEGYNAKQIARLVGGSYNSVNTLTREIRRRLGPLPNGDLVERAELARAYRAWKARKPPDLGDNQRIDLYSVDISKPPDPRSDSGVDHRGSPVDQAGPLADEQQPYSARPAFALIDLVPLRTDRRPHNDLSWKVVLIAFGILVCLALIAAGSSASLLEALNSLDRN